MNDLKGIIEDCNKSDLVSDKIIKKIIEIIGQEEWQDLHDENNDICTTMGELIITLKGISELEKEIAELKADNDARKFAMAMSEKVEKQLREENEKLKTDYEVLSCSVGDFGELQDRLEEEQRKNNGLEEENAELKEEMNAKQVVLNDFKSRVETVTDRFNRKSSQLTKAKELIEDMYDAIPSSHSDYYKDVMERARQFLSEVEK